jgi:hypothetical protein
MLEVGATWNESRTWPDPLTGRTVRSLSTAGRINQTPTYHTNSGFSADGRFIAFVSVREGATWLLRAEVESGELKALWRAPGVGDRNYVHRGMSLAFEDVDGRGVCGNRVCMAPRRGLAVLTCERRLLAVDLASCEERLLIEDVGEEWIFGAPCLDPEEKFAVITASSAHPQILAGEKATKRYGEFMDHRLRLLRVPLDGGPSEPEVLYRHSPAQSAHSAFRPTNGGPLYFDLDLPPGYWGGSDGKTPRIWLLDLASGEARPVKTGYPGAFQTHTAWLWDGSALCYHGGAREGGEYFGLVTPDGETLWERVFPEARAYGHNTPDAKRPALIIDGSFSTDRLQWLYYDDGGAGEARLEPICLHATEWKSLPGQYSHPHPLTDPGGRWVSFTRARGGRSDVCVVEV